MDHQISSNSSFITFILQTYFSQIHTFIKLSKINFAGFIPPCCRNGVPRMSSQCDNYNWNFSEKKNEILYCIEHWCLKKSNIDLSNHPKPVVALDWTLPLQPWFVWWWKHSHVVNMGMFSAVDLWSVNPALAQSQLGSARSLSTHAQDKLSDNQCFTLCRTFDVQWILNQTFGLFFNNWKSWYFSNLMARRTVHTCHRKGS